MPINVLMLFIHMIIFNREIYIVAGLNKFLHIVVSILLLYCWLKGSSWIVHFGQNQSISSFMVNFRYSSWVREEHDLLGGAWTHLLQRVHWIELCLLLHSLSQIGPRYLGLALLTLLLVLTIFSAVARMANYELGER